MTSHKEQPAVDTSAEKLAGASLVYADGVEAFAARTKTDDAGWTNGLALHLRETATALRSFAAHPAEPAFIHAPLVGSREPRASDMPTAYVPVPSITSNGTGSPAEPPGMELETTAEERAAWLRAGLDQWRGTAPDILKDNQNRLIRDFDRIRARAEKAEAALAEEKARGDEQWEEKEDAERGVEELTSTVEQLRAALAALKQPVSDEEVEALARFHQTQAGSEDQSTDAWRFHNKAHAIVRRLSTQLRDAQARGKGMEEALKPFANMLPDTLDPKDALSRRLQEWCRAARTALFSYTGEAS